MARRGVIPAVVMCSAHTDQRDRDDARGLGVACVDKVNMDTLAAVLVASHGAA